MNVPGGTPLISRLEPDDCSAVARIVEASGLEVDLQAELAREFALPWVARNRASAEPLAFSLAWSVADELQLLDIATHPDHRRKGLARALLSALLDHARRTQKRLFLLEVRASNRPAIALYQDLGFQTTGVRRGYYSDTGEDALEMRITFDPNTGEILREDER